MKWKALANNLLDALIEHVGLNECADMLVSIDYTKEDLLQLGFEEDTIEDSLERVNQLREQ
jgi:hypothetical protein